MQRSMPAADRFTFDTVKLLSSQTTYCVFMVDPVPPGDAAALLESVLAPLLDDFETSFQRGLTLLEVCPDTVLPAPARETLHRRLLKAQAELSAARALRAAAPAPMALEMATITPWHELLVEVWSLSAALRAAGIRLPAGRERSEEPSD
jgi:hypothetical protein